MVLHIRLEIFDFEAFMKFRKLLPEMNFMELVIFKSYLNEMAIPFCKVEKFPNDTYQ